MNLIIGSNQFSGSTGILKVQGREQIGLEIGERDGQVLLDMDFYDSAGEHIAKLNRNSWVFHDGRYSINSAPSSLTLTETETGKVILQASVKDRTTIEIKRGNVYTHQGHLLEITPHYWKIGSMTMSGNRIDSAGTAVSLG